MYTLGGNLNSYSKNINVKKHKITNYSSNVDLNNDFNSNVNIVDYNNDSNLMVNNQNNSVEVPIQTQKVSLEIPSGSKLAPVESLSESDADNVLIINDNIEINTVEVPLEHISDNNRSGLKLDPWYKDVGDGFKVGVASVVSGASDIVEGITDGLLMAGSYIGTPFAFLIDGKEGVDKYHQDAKNIIEKDWSESIYDSLTEVMGVSDENKSALSGAHNISNTVVSMAGYTILSITTGGAIKDPALGSAINAAVGATSSAGTSADRAFNSGATYGQTAVVSTVSGIAGGASGWGVGKINTAAAGTNSIKKIVGYTAAGASVSSVEPVVNSVVEYATYGHNMTDINGTSLYDNFGDYYINGGGLFNTVLAAGTGALSTGTQSFKGYKDTKIKLKKQVILTDADITALLQDANYNDYYIRWSKRKLTNLLHDKFDNIFGKNQISALMDRIIKVDDNYWPTLLKQRGLADSTLGFVDSSSNLYLPQSANEHTAFHEALHLVSEIDEINSGPTVIDANGNYHKKTGIREFYSDGFNSTWANETLTEYLASKYTDEKIYNSIYEKSNVKLWNRIDDAMFEAYGLNGTDLLLNSYITNDTTAIRKFFNDYSSKGTYDDFVRAMGNFNLNYLDSIVSSIEKNVYKQNNSIFSRLKSMFGLNTEI